MAMTPSVGDILMLSQTAWKIGRAFTKGKKGAPEEFGEVERECDGLSEALKLVAETLHADGSILMQAEDHTRYAVSTILESAQKTLEDLESFVERYRVLKKTTTNGGFVVEEKWSEVVMANYKTLKWTTEGGDVTELRNMLHMHTNTINLTMQALQSRSLARLEKTVMPMAENVASIHDRVNGDLGDKIDDLHRIIMSVANSTPSLMARDIDSHPRIGSRASIGTVSTLEHGAAANGNIAGAHLLEAPPLRTSPNAIPIRHYDRRMSDRSQYVHVDQSKSQQSLQSVSGASGRSKRDPQDSAYYSISSMTSKEANGHSQQAGWAFDGRPLSDARLSIGNHVHGHALEAGPSTAAQPSSNLLMAGDMGSRRRSNMLRRESSTLPNMFNMYDDATPGSELDECDLKSSPVSPHTQQLERHINEAFRDNLPPPALPPDIIDGKQPEPATPASFFASPQRTQSKTAHHRQASGQTPASRAINSRNSPTSLASSSNPGAPTFEKSLFRNAAILCDVRGALVEYLQEIPDEPDPRHNTEMVPACKESRICVIRKRENCDHGGTQVVTSVWTMSDDGKVRCQQKLSEVNETVPYCSFFEPEKVSLPPTEGEMTIRFHAENWSDRPEKEVKTGWINYVFDTEDGAIAFQSALFGRQLLGSFQTLKTTVVHEGFKGTFAFEEQFANIEMLRLWEEDGISVPGAQGGVLALMHLGSNFGEGWARWWMNSSKQQVRVKDDGGKFAKVKGIDVRTVRPGAGASTADKIRSPSTAGGESLPRRPSEPVGGQRRRSSALEKRVTGVKIEFKAEEDKLRFLAMAKKVQERMIALPDL